MYQETTIYKEREKVLQLDKQIDFDLKKKVNQKFEKPKAKITSQN